MMENRWTGSRPRVWMVNSCRLRPLSPVKIPLYSKPKKKPWPSALAGTRRHSPISIIKKACPPCLLESSIQNEICYSPIHAAAFFCRGSIDGTAVSLGNGERSYCGLEILMHRRPQFREMDHHTCAR